MSLLNTLYSANGKNCKTILFADEGLKITGKEFDTVEELNAAWQKKISLVTKTTIKYEKIKSVTKEDTEEKILLKYKGPIGITMEFPFTFSDPSNNEKLYQWLVNEKGFSRTDEKLSPLKAASGYIIGLLFIIAFTLFAHYEALEIENGTAIKSGSSKTRAFLGFIEMIGDNGVWAIGILSAAYVMYKIWQRYTNPPNQIKLVL